MARAAAVGGSTRLDLSHEGDYDPVYSPSRYWRTASAHNLVEAVRLLLASLAVTSHSYRGWFKAVPRSTAPNESRKQGRASQGIRSSEAPPMSTVASRHDLSKAPHGFDRVRHPRKSSLCLRSA